MHSKSKTKRWNWLQNLFLDQQGDNNLATYDNEPKFLFSAAFLTHRQENHSKVDEFFINLSSFCNKIVSSYEDIVSLCYRIKQEDIKCWLVTNV